MVTKIGSVDPTIVDEVLTRQIAAAAISGVSQTAIAKQLGISVAAVKGIQNSEKYKNLVSQVADDELTPALAKAKSALSKLSVKAVRVVEKAMDDYLNGQGSARDALPAANTALRAVGLHEEKEKQGDTSITVIMPGGVGAQTEQVIEVKDADST